MNDVACGDIIHTRDYLSLCFKTGEVTPEEAHRIGVSTARIMWRSNYEVLVTTHLNTDNIHNHFVVNSVSFKTGKKFENHIRDHVELRKISDEVCKEHGKSVIPFDHFYGNKKEYWARESGITHRQMLQADLDEALSKCCTDRELFRYLEGLGYKIVRDSNYAHVSIIAEGWKRPVRLSSLVEEYSNESIRDRLVANQYDPELYIFRPPQKKRTPLLEVTKHIPISVGEYTLLMTYEVVVALLQAYKEDTSKEKCLRPLFLTLREELVKLEQYTEDVTLLTHNKINTTEDLLKFQNNLQGQISELEQERYKLRLKIRRARTPEIADNLKEQAKEITKKIHPLRKQFKSTLRTAERSPKIKEILEQEERMERECLSVPYKNRTERTRY